MYCKYCGEHNSNDQTYCQNCGSQIKTNTILSENLNITEEKSTFCKKCGTQVLDRYCTECGTVAYTLDLGQRSTKTILNFGSFEMDDIKSKMGEASFGDIKSKIKETPLGDIKGIDDVKEIIKSKPVIKSSAISSIKILGIGLIISFLLFSMISKTGAMGQMLNAIDMAAAFTDQQISKLKPNFIDLFNLSLLSPIKFSTNLTGGYGEVGSIGFDMIMSFKLLALLVIPIIGVVISQLNLFKDESSTRENLLEYGVTSLIFSIVVKIIALVSQKSIKIDAPYSVARLDFSAGFKSFFDVLSVFLLVFVIHLVVSMIFKRDNPFEIFNIKQSPDLGDRSYTYIKSMAAYTGIVAIVLMLTFVFALTKEGLEFKNALTFGFLVLPLGFVHTWLLSFGNGISTSMTGQSTASLNITKMWKGIGSIKEASYLDSTSWTIWGYILIISIFVGLIYVLFKTLKDIEKEGYFVNLAYVAGAISVINLLMTYLVSIVIKTNSKSLVGSYEIRDLMYELGLGSLADFAGPGVVNIFYPLFMVILLSCVWVFAIGGIIYLAREQDIYHKLVAFVEEHSLKLIAGYSALVLVASYLLQTEIIATIVYELANIFPLLNMMF